MTLRKKVNKKQAEITCRRQRKRFLRRAAQKKYIVIRGLSMVLILGTFLYLMSLAHWKERFFEVRKDYSIEFEDVKAKEDPSITELYGVIFRIKSGELELYRSRKSAEKVIP